MCVYVYIYTHMKFYENKSLKRVVEIHGSQALSGQKLDSCSCERNGNCKEEMSPEERMQQMFTTSDTEELPESK